MPVLFYTTIDNLLQFFFNHSGDNSISLQMITKLPMALFRLTVIYIKKFSLNPTPHFKCSKPFMNQTFLTV